MYNQVLNLHPFVQAGIGGVIIGLATWLLLASIGRVAGISGITAVAVFGAKQRIGQSALSSPDRAWRIMFLVGLIIVGALFAKWFGSSSVIAVANQSFLLTIGAGLLVGFGTVLGSGCTSGHGVCGIGRRSLRSTVATLIFMVAGVATTSLMHLLNR
jgi:uncharacterized protein